ncbi:hypothetical protein N0V88_008047 [Collariella sp. IMI 366227]|nr:hypothetical protein N0V88_008047 [Collariella sp. IMI 366227]
MDMVEPNAHPVSMAEDEPNSGFSHDEGGSSGDDTSHNGPASPAFTGNKRKRTQYQKTSADPACSWCARHNRTCVYLERQKPGSRIGFTLELETKLNRVDALLQTLWRRVEDHIAHDHASASQQTLSPPVSNPDASQVDGYPPHPEGAGAASRPGGVRENFLAHRGKAWRDKMDFKLARKVARGHLPPPDMIYTLVDLYFKHCNTWCPILDRKTTFGVFFGSTSQSEVDRILLHAIVATTLRFLKDLRLTPEMKAHYHAVSKNTVMIYAMEHVSVAALRALVILSLDELGTSNGPQGWNLLSLLAQNVRHLDLWAENTMYLSAAREDFPHTGSVRRVAVGRPESWIEDEGRRRLCWMVYLLDRYATVATTTFDFMLDDKKMKRMLPCSYDLFSRNVPVETGSLDPTPESGRGGTIYAVKKPENLGSFSYHCQILRILSQVHDFLKTPIDVSSATEMEGWRNTYRSLDSALDNWLQRLPSEYSRISALCHSDPASRVANWFMLHSAYVTSVVRLHSSAAYPIVRSHLFVPSHYAMQRCLSAVQSLRDITQDVYDANGLDLVGPPFAFSLWTAARLLIVHASATNCPVDGKIDFFIDILTYVGQYWEVADNYARILARVTQKGRHGGVLYAVMRESAYDIVGITSSTRRSGLDETCSQSVSLSELDNIDVFDFFNYPKVAKPGAGSMTRAAGAGQADIMLQP